MTHCRPAQRGFTLIELMVTILIAAILVGVAIPTYSTHMRKSRRTEARNAVLDAAAREERLFATTNRYSQAAADLGYQVLPQTIQYYQLKVQCTPDVATCSGYTIQAVPQGTQVKDAACGTFQVDQTGKQSVTGALAADATAPCWN